MGRRKHQSQYELDPGSSPEEDNRRKKIASEEKMGDRNETLDLDENQFETIKKLLTQQSQAIADSEQRIKDSIASRINELEQRIVDVEDVNKELLEKNRSLERRLVQVERDSRRLNIVVSGLDDESPEKNYKELQRIIDTATGNNLVQVSGIWTLKTKASGPKIIATCKNLDEKRLIMQAKKQFVWKKDGKSTQIFVDDDLPPADRRIQSRLRAIAREKRGEGKDVRVALGRLKIDGHWQDYDPEKDDVALRTFRNEK